MYYIRPVFTDIERVLNDKFLSLNITQWDRFLLFLLDIDETWQKLVWIVTASKQVSSLLIVLLGVNDVMRTEKSSPPQKKKKKKKNGRHASPLMLSILDCFLRRVFLLMLCEKFQHIEHWQPSFLIFGKNFKILKFALALLFSYSLI